MKFRTVVVFVIVSILMLVNSFSPSLATFSGNEGSILMKDLFEEQLFLVDPHDGQITNLDLNLPDDYFANHFQFSPDGIKLVFHMGPVDEYFEIYTVNLDGTNLERLTFDACRDKYPSWANGGESIVFLRTCTGFPNSEIYIMKSDGTEKERLTTNSFREYLPAASPRCNEIALVNSSGNSQIWLSDSISPEPDFHQLGDVLFGVFNSNSPLSWSPDGRWLATSSQLGESTVNLVIVNRNTEIYERITQGLPVYGYNPIWSPKGDSLVFNNFTIAWNDEQNPDGTTSGRSLTTDVHIFDFISGTSQTIISDTYYRIQDWQPIPVDYDLTIPVPELDAMYDPCGPLPNIELLQTASSSIERIMMDNELFTEDTPFCWKVDESFFGEFDMPSMCPSPNDSDIVQFQVELNPVVLFVSHLWFTNQISDDDFELFLGRQIDTVDSIVIQETTFPDSLHNFDAGNLFSIVISFAMLFVATGIGVYSILRNSKFNY